MLLKLKACRVYDPAHGVNGEVRDLYVQDGRIVAPPAADARIDQEYDLTGRVVMAGAIDMHTHIGGGKLNIARAMLPEDHRGDPVRRTALTRASSGHAAPGTLATGYRYAEMGYTACFEPAILPVNARQAHLEMGDTPIVDKGGYVMLGSDDFLLRLMASNGDQQLINDYVAWTLDATRCIGIKVVNPGGISAFKFNQRELDIDEKHPYYRVTPRDILRVLSPGGVRAGRPASAARARQQPGRTGQLSNRRWARSAPRKVCRSTSPTSSSTATAPRATASSPRPRPRGSRRRSTAQPNATCDVGQILFGQTVTASGDAMAQHRNAAHGRARGSTS